MHVSSQADGEQLDAISQEDLGLDTYSHSVKADWYGCYLGADLLISVLKKDFFVILTLSFFVLQIIIPVRILNAKRELLLHVILCRKSMSSNLDYALSY